MISPQVLLWGGYSLSLSFCLYFLLVYHYLGAYYGNHYHCFVLTSITPYHYHFCHPNRRKHYQKPSGFGSLHFGLGELMKIIVLVSSLFFSNHCYQKTTLFLLSFKTTYLIFISKNQDKVSESVQGTFLQVMTDQKTVNHCLADDKSIF